MARVAGRAGAPRCGAESLRFGWIYSFEHALVALACFRELFRRDGRVVRVMRASVAVARAADGRVIMCMWLFSPRGGKLDGKLWQSRKVLHARAQAREPPATFVQNAGLCTTRGSPVVPSASTGSVGDPTSPGGVARVLNPWPVRPARPGAHWAHCRRLPAPFGALAVRGRSRVLRVSARCACARRPRAGGGIAFVRHMSFLNGRSCTFGKLTPLWTLVRGTSVESRSPSRAAVGDLAVLHRGPGASEPL